MDFNNTCQHSLAFQFAKFHFFKEEQCLLLWKGPSSEEKANVTIDSRQNPKLLNCYGLCFPITWTSIGLGLCACMCRNVSYLLDQMLLFNDKDKGNWSPIQMVISTLVEQNWGLTKLNNLSKIWRESVGTYWFKSISIFLQRYTQPLHYSKDKIKIFFIVKDVQRIFFYEIAKYFTMVLTFKGIGTFPLKLKLRH